MSFSILYLNRIAPWRVHSEKARRRWVIRHYWSQWTRKIASLPIIVVIPSSVPPSIVPIRQGASAVTITLVALPLRGGRNVLRPYRTLQHRLFLNLVVTHCPTVPRDTRVWDIRHPPVSPRRRIPRAIIITLLPRCTLAPPRRPTPPLTYQFANDAPQTCNFKICSKSNDYATM